MNRIDGKTTHLRFSRIPFFHPPFFQSPALSGIIISSRGFIVQHFSRLPRTSRWLIKTKLTGRDGESPLSKSKEDYKSEQVYTTHSLPEGVMRPLL